MGLWVQRPLPRMPWDGLCTQILASRSLEGRLVLSANGRASLIGFTFAGPAFGDAVNVRLVSDSRPHHKAPHVRQRFRNTSHKALFLFLSTMIYLSDNLPSPGILFCTDLSHIGRGTLHPNLYDKPNLSEPFRTCKLFKKTFNSINRRRG